MKPILEARGLSIGYATTLIHKDLNLNLFPGELTCILGLNGAGKTTLLRTLCGFLPALEGQIILAGKPLSSYTPNRLSLTIGVVLTENTHTGDLSAHDLVALGRHPHTGFFGVLKKEDNEIIEQSLKAVGMLHKGKLLTSEMSDGERQKVMIAKALSQECPIIILDEPTAFLDVGSRIESMLLLRKLAKEQNKAILISTHDIEQAIQMADTFWLLRNNSQLICGTPEDLILNGEINSFFDKNNITFDIHTGKLSSPAPTSPIGIDGDPLVAYWLGNALVRNRFKPSPPGHNYPNVVCSCSRNFTVILPNNIHIPAQSISHVLNILLAQ
ncbi:MAG: ABC transporter ATP-binding protein [Tannerellaceae bacterium]|jgi:iron complex transport system ATP-binding protein|nr:ABC transporter ATP-binding protein [Tannerellaceae bacterium]